MPIYIKTHIVQKREILEDIVFEYDIPNAKILRYFHNQNTLKNSNHIGSVIFAGQEISIPEKWDVRRIMEVQKKLSANKNKQKEYYIKNKILYLDIPAIKKHYQVKISNSKNGFFKVFCFDVHFRYVNTAD